MSIQVLREIIQEPSTWNHTTIPRVQIEAAIIEVAALEAENKALCETAAEMTANNIRLHEKFSPLEARLAEAEDKLATEQAEHTREVLLHAVTKHKLDEASELNSQCPAILDAANARADAEKERADRAERAYEGAALQLCKDWQEHKDYLFDTEQRAEKAEADAGEMKMLYGAANARADAAWEECGQWRHRRDLAVVRAEEAEEQADEFESRAESAEAEAARLRGVLQKVEAYLSSDESPLHTLWENGAICAYDETPCESWREVLAQLRDFNIPADCLGYGAEWPAVTLYREIYAALQEGREGGPK